MKSHLKFVGLVTLAHLVTYVFAGVVAQVGLGVKDFYPPSPHAISYLRDPLSAYVQFWLWPAQLVRGVLFGLALLPFRSRISALGQLRGGLALAALMFVVAYLAASGGLIEHLVYFNEYPLRFAVITVVEIALQTVLMGQWVAWRECRALEPGIPALPAPQG